MVFAAGPSTAAEPVDASPSPVVGMVVPLDGEDSRIGEQLVESARLAADDAGVEIEAVDEGASSADTVRAIRRLGERRDVVAIVGPLGRDRSAAAARAARRIDVPLVVYSSRQGVEREGPSVFRARPSPDEQSRRIGRYLVEELDVDGVGVMGPRTNYGDEFVPSLIEAIDERGGRIEGLARYGEETTDFGPAVETLTGSRVEVGTGRGLAGRVIDSEGTIDVGRDSTIDFEALVVADVHHRVARLLPFLPRVGIATAGAGEGASVQLVGPAGWRGDGLERAAEHAAGAVFFETFGGEADGARARQFVIEFRNRTGREVTTPEAEIYDLVSVIGSLVEGTERDDRRRQLADRLRVETTREGVTGPWGFDSSGAPIRELRPYQVTTGGEWVPVSSSER